MNLHPHNEYRPITIIATLQIVGVLLACVLASALLKVWGMGDSTSDAQFPKAAVILRDYGWSCLALPLTWVAFAFVAKRRDGPRWENLAALVVGFAIIGFLVWLSVTLGVGIFSQPF